VSGLAPTVDIVNHESTDHLELDDLQVGDTVNTAGLAAGAIQLFIDGGLFP
jgi:hypothetical protein